jgi:hypothetical protein
MNKLSVQESSKDNREIPTITIPILKIDTLPDTREPKEMPMKIILTSKPKVYRENPTENEPRD